MRLRLRLLLLIISSLWRKRINILDESVLNFRVLPNDIDVTKITNDRYISIMDLGRMDIAFRVGLMKPMIKKKWAPLATFNTIRFRYHLKLFQKYKLHTRIVYWDKKTFYFEQRFERHGRIVATGYVSSTALGPEGPICPEEIIAEIGHSVIRPPKPDIISKLQAIDNMIHKSQKEMK